MNADVKRAVSAIAVMLAFAASFLVAGFATDWHGMSEASPNVGVCDNSSGNVDGSPCNWQDTSTGQWRANDSSEYRKGNR